jgi:hypothetical protein
VTLDEPGSTAPRLGAASGAKLDYPPLARHLDASLAAKPGPAVDRVCAERLQPGIVVPGVVMEQQQVPGAAATGERKGV